MSTWEFDTTTGEGSVIVTVVYEYESDGGKCIKCGLTVVETLSYNFEKHNQQICKNTKVIMKFITKCEDCDYTTKNITTLKIHKLNKLN